MELFEELIKNHKEKKVVSYAKKLIKKCSFNSGESASNLCALTYWLYVYGYEDDVMKLCEMTHSIEFPGKGGFNVWDYLFFMWGLEIYLLKKKGLYEKANEIISIMDKYLYSSSLSREAEIERRNRFTFDYVAYINKIDNAYSNVLANEFRMSALYRLIGYTYTGLFPNLVKDKDKIEDTIKEYISILEKTK